MTNPFTFAVDGHIYRNSVIYWNNHSNHMAKTKKSSWSSTSHGRQTGSKRQSYAQKGGSAKRFKKSNGYSSANARIGGFLGIEKKFLDSNWNTVTISPGGTGGGASGGELQPTAPASELCISAPVQGSGEQELDGRKYCIKSVAFSGVIDTTAIDAAAGLVESFGYFFALVLDTQTNGATINSEDVYLNATDSPRGCLPYPLRNLQNVVRFKVLDSVYISSGGKYAFNKSSTTANSSLERGLIVKLNWSGNINVNKLAATGVVGSIADNSLHILAFAGSSNDTPTFTGKARMRFIG